MVPWSLAGSLRGETICGLMILGLGLALYVGVRSFYELLKPRWVQPRRLCWWLALLVNLIMVLGCGLIAYALAV